jgi:SOS response regulatory protein OraA/RecX
MEFVAQRLKGRGLRDPREYRRSFAYLLRRGYSLDVIEAVLRRLKKESDLATG